MRYSLLSLCLLVGACSQPSNGGDDTTQPDAGHISPDRGPSVCAEEPCGLAPRSDVVLCNPQEVPSGEPPSFEADVAFGALQFEDPVDLEFHGGYAYVAERGGRILRFEDDSEGAQPAPFLDLRENVGGGRVLGFELAADFGVSGDFYVYYLQDDATVRLSRFTADPGASYARPETEQEVISRAAGSLLSPGGALEADASGLYVGVDDAILHIAADGTQSQHAAGLAGPNRCAMDETGLWCTDVGSDSSTVLRVSAGEVSRIFEYPHADEDCGAVGGAVYRGNAAPDLRGTYLFADACSGRVRGISIDAPESGARIHVSLVSKPGGFGVDSHGEVYLLDGFAGRVSKLVRGDDGFVLPESLLATGCFGPDARPSADLIPYDIASPLWSDGTAKGRYMALPPGKKVHIRADGTWDFPAGSVLLKNFGISDPDDPARIRPVETRIMVRRADAWGFHTYEWEPDGSDARRLTDGKSVPLTSQLGNHEWQFPDRDGCRACHRVRPVLGPRTEQIDVTLDYGGAEINQLDELRRIGAVEGESTVAALPAPDDEAHSLEQRARAYLHGNCSHCHVPGGYQPADLTMNLRADVPLEDANICGTPLQYFSVFAPGEKRIDPGNPENSNIYQRMISTGYGRMPPLGTTVVDEEAAELVRQWIDSLECP